MLARKPSERSQEIVPANKRFVKDTVGATAINVRKSTHAARPAQAARLVLQALHAHPQALQAADVSYLYIYTQGIYSEYGIFGTFPLKSGS